MTSTIIPAAAVQAKIEALQHSIDHHQKELIQLDGRREQLIQQIERHHGALSALQDLVQTFSPASDEEE